MEALATTMSIYPLTLLTKYFSLMEDAQIEDIFARITQKLSNLESGRVC
jgi:hypothetical protein